MAALALVIGGVTGHFLLFVVIVLFVLGGVIALAHDGIELRDRWKQRIH